MHILKPQSYAHKLQNSKLGSYHGNSNMAGPPGIRKNFNINCKKKNYENYVEFYFSIGTVLVIFSISRTDKITSTPPSNFFLYPRKKANKN